ncbi:hypothetical protein [Loktanella sp. R86503]|uniref:hypothetical protein n=1 Tax=Loktanella sp. R86503 TaxID=3093847 RepID=UPI0036D929DA
MLVSQASSHGVELREGSRLRPIYDERGTFLGNDVVPMGWYAKGPDGGKAATADVVRKAMTPAPVDTIEEWLAELSVITARRAEDEFTGALRVDAYSRRLAGYPADVVKAALFDSKWKFWPTWAELAEVCDKAVAKRKAMAAALDGKDAARAASMAGEEHPERVSATRAAEIMAAAGFKPRTFGGEA